MMLVAAPLDTLQQLAFFCPACTWAGKGVEAVIQPHDVVRCPVCHAALIEDACEAREVGGVPF